jgi:hypothetical protein
MLINPQSSQRQKWVNMRRPREAGEAGKATRLLAWICFFSLAGILAGCSSASKAKEDPLFGVGGTHPGGPPPASTPRSKNEVSSAPSSTGPNLASLATLPDSRPLAIATPQAPATGNTDAVALASTPKSATGATLSAPVPFVQPVPRVGEDPVVPASSWARAPEKVPGNAAPAQAAAPSTAGEATPVPTVSGINIPQPPVSRTAAPAAAPQQALAEDPLLTQLRSHGITSQKNQNVEGGVRFSCMVPNRQNPEVARMYEAIGPDWHAAVRAVLWKIEKDQKAAAP